MLECNGKIVGNLKEVATNARIKEFNHIFGFKFLLGTLKIVPFK